MAMETDGKWPPGIDGSATGGGGGWQRPQRWRHKWQEWLVGGIGAVFQESGAGRRWCRPPSMNQ